MSMALEKAVAPELSEAEAVRLDTQGQIAALLSQSLTSSYMTCSVMLRYAPSSLLFDRWNQPYLCGSHDIIQSPFLFPPSSSFDPRLMASHSSLPIPRSLQAWSSRSHSGHQILIFRPPHCTPCLKPQPQHLQLTHREIRLKLQGNVLSY